MIMRLPDVGSQYLIGFLDADKKYFDGGKTCKVTLPPNLPARAFWPARTLLHEAMASERDRTGQMKTQSNGGPLSACPSGSLTNRD